MMLLRELLLLGIINGWRVSIRPNRSGLRDNPVRLLQLLLRSFGLIILKKVSKKTSTLEKKSKKI